MCAGIEDKDTSVTGEFLLLCGFHFVKLSTVCKEIPPLGFPHDALPHCLNLCYSAYIAIKIFCL